MEYESLPEDRLEDAADLVGGFGLESVEVPLFFFAVKV